MSILQEQAPTVNAPPPQPHGNRFDIAFSVAEVPKELVEATEHLTNLAQVGWCNEWRDVSDGEFVVCQREAIALCRRALDEIELICDYSARRAADHFRAELARLEKQGEVTA